MVHTFARLLITKYSVLSFGVIEGLFSEYDPKTLANTGGASLRNEYLLFQNSFRVNCGLSANLMKEFWGAVKGFERKSFENNTLDGVRDVATFPIHKRTP